MAPNKAHAKLLNDLARSGLEVEDPEVQAKYEDFRIEVTKQALAILKEKIPVKILHFNELVRQGTSQGKGFLHADDLPEFQIPQDFSSSDAGRPAKRSRTENDDSSHVHVQKSETQPQVVELGKTIRKEALELIEMVDTVKLWVQLNVPRIEDGNNFGVAIQEEAIQELSRVEDAAFTLCDGIKYHMARAKLMSKLLKYPNNADYARCIHEVDVKEWLHLKVSLIDMRNSYSMLHDLLHKNWEKVVKPKNSDGSFMVM